MIVDPITMSPHQTVQDALEVMARYRISGIPITEGPKLVGILTNRDLRFVSDTTQPISALMTKDQPGDGVRGHESGRGTTLASRPSH